MIPSGDYEGANRYYTNEWLKGVSTSGIFYKSSSMNSWPTGAHGIPSGWTIMDYTE